MTSPVVKALADRYTLGTADRVPRPKPKHATERPVEFPPYAVFWTSKRRGLFKAWSPSALVVAGPKGPVPRGLGDNRLAWPIRIGSSDSFADKQTKIMDSYSALWWQGAWFRVWVPTVEHRRRLRSLVIDALPHEPLRHLWVDIGPDLRLPGLKDVTVEQDLGLHPLPPRSLDQVEAERLFKVTRRKLELFIHQVAGHHEIQTWDDLRAEFHLDALERDAEAQARRAMQRDVGMGETS